MKKLLVILVSTVLFLLTACGENNNTNTDKSEVDIEITKTEKTLLSGTVDEFKMYTFTTNVPGPTIFIVGGTHGDEVAGYLAGTETLNYEFKKGTIIIVPRISTVAIANNQRFMKSEGYTDLNRAFPGKVDGTKTEKIAYTLFNEITLANPDYVIDLHESRDNWEVYPYLGDSIIAHTSSGNLDVGLLGSEFVEEYNRNRDNSYSAFTLLNNPPIGTLNRTVSDTFTIPVFTIETNRKLNQEIRVNQQKMILEIMLNYIWHLDDN